MGIWSSGYVADIAYTHGFYRRMTPAHLRLSALLCGRAAPIGDALTYAELGCGQGFGTLLIAAANPAAMVYGFDFNPEQIHHARRLAERAGLVNVVFEEISFEELSQRPRGDLPEFDMVALHGVYSWIGPEAAADIRRFLRTKLKPAGLVYVSYNAMPGCAAVQPLQRLLRDEAARASGPSDDRAKAALAFAGELAAKGSLFFKEHPAVARRLGQHERQSPTYLAHEYLNGHWRPRYVTEIAAELEEAKLGFVGSARLAENELPIAVPAAAAALLEGIDDPLRRELLKDYWANRPFRADVFQKGAPRIDGAVERAALRAQRVGLMVAPSKIDGTFKTPAGGFECRPGVLAPILERLAEGPAALGELEGLVGGDIGLNGLRRLIVLLDASDQLMAAPGEAFDPRPAARLNRVLAESWTGPYRYVAAPALGGALEAGAEDLFLLGLLEEGAGATLEELVEAGHLRLRGPEGDRTARDGLLRRAATRFLDEVLPLWRAAGVVAENAPQVPRIAAVS
ncbi:MAG TPA: methyltransferase regulatory domain-containing protein [Salinarimonas sp.]|nr:methyltransferase regulatory domain-containing protein [Salinarimonas sp.]